MDALEVSYERIINILPSCGRGYQSYSHYCDFMEEIVRDEKWSEKEVEYSITPSLTGRMD